MPERNQPSGLYWYVGGGVTFAAASISIIQFFSGAQNLRQFLGEPQQKPANEGSPVEPGPSASVADPPADQPEPPPSMEVPRDPVAPMPGAYTPKESSGPSYNCAIDRKPVEQTICNIVELSVLDREMATLYGKLKERLIEDQRVRLVEDQKEWLKQRNNCNGPEVVACIRGLYETRIPYLRSQLNE